MKITEYSHLNLSQEEFDIIVAVDPAIQAHKDRIAQEEAMFPTYLTREQEYRSELEKWYTKETELRAELKIISSEKRTLRGRLSSNIQKERRSKAVIKRCEVRIRMREKDLLRFEVQRKLNALSKRHRVPKIQPLI